MKKVLIICALGILSACSDASTPGAGKENTETPTKEVSGKEMTKEEKIAAEGAQKAKTVDEAMSEIEPADRKDFQAALSCQVKNNKGPAIEITPEYVRGLYAKLKQDRSIASC